MHGRVNRMKKEKITKPFTLVAAIYTLYFILRVMDLFILRTDQTWVGEAIIHKLLGIVIMSIIACRLGFKPEEIGFSKGKSILNVFNGLAFGFGVYGIAYAAEIIMAKAAGSFDSLRFYVSAYAIDKNSGNRTGFLFFILCIIGNVINVLMEEGNFRGLFPRILGEKYAFTSFKGLGHSNGGLVYTAFLQQYLTEHANLELEKLITIGSPYNLNKKEISDRVPMLDDFVANQEKLPKKLQHLSILGIFFRDGDGIVHRSSVEAGSLIYKGKIASHREVVITGKAAHHSSLPQNEQVIDLIKEFLF